MKLRDDEIEELLRKQNEMFFQLEMKMVRENVPEGQNGHAAPVNDGAKENEVKEDEENFEAF